MQGKCRVCQKKTRYVRSTCNDEMEDVNGESPTPWLCHTETGRMCFPEHVTALHITKSQQDDSPVLSRARYLFIQHFQVIQLVKCQLMPGRQQFFDMGFKTTAQKIELDRNRPAEVVRFLLFVVRK